MGRRKQRPQETQQHTALEDSSEVDAINAEDLKAWEILKAMRQPFLEIPPEEVAEETDRILSEIREENRRNRSTEQSDN